MPQIKHPRSQTRPQKPTQRRRRKSHQPHRNEWIQRNQAQQRLSEARSKHPRPSRTARRGPGNAEQHLNSTARLAQLEKGVPVELLGRRLRRGGRGGEAGLLKEEGRGGAFDGSEGGLGGDGGDEGAEGADG